MASIAISRLHWKELRTQGVIWIALFAMCVMFAIAVIVLVDQDNLGVAMDSLIFVAPALFALACGSFAFASEDETGTIGVLRRLPINSRDVLRAKLGFGLIGLLLFYVLFAAVVWIAAFQLKPGIVAAPGHLHYAFWGLEALLWSAFFSMRTRSSLASAAWTAVTIGVVTFAFEWLGVGNVMFQIAAYSLRILLLGYIGMRLITQCDEWFHDFEIQSKPSFVDWIINASHRLPRDVARVLWLSWRENRALILTCVGAIGFFIVTAIYFAMNNRFDRVETIARNGYTELSQRGDGTFNLPKYFGFIVVSSLAIDVLSAALGLVVFGTFRQLRQIPMLIHQGISARLISIVRIALFGALQLTIVSALYAVTVVSIIRWVGQRDGSGAMELVFTLPGWCFVGTLWSSFHTNKKVVAFFAGIILGTVATIIQFAFTRYGIAPQIWGYSIFFWLSIAAIVYTVLFAQSWARQSWGRLHRMASWCVFPLALAGIYGGTAAYRIYDVPDISTMNLDIPMPQNVPKVESIFAKSMIDLEELFGERISDPELAALFYRDDSGYRHPYIDTDKFQQWLDIDPLSLKWRAADLDQVNLLYQCFLELEPEIQRVRDTLLSKNRVVFLSSGSGAVGDEGNWLIVGAYAKLKESKPDESLAYIKSMFRWSQNNYYYRFHERDSIASGIGPSPIQMFGGRLSESTALFMLNIWAEQPSVMAQPDLIREAVQMIPEPGFDRDLITYGIVRARNWRISHDDDDFTYVDFRYPVNRQVHLVSRLLVPWEAERRRILIDQAAYWAYQVRLDPSPAARARAQGEFRRYRNRNSSLLNINSDALDEARVATQQNLEKALAGASELKD